MKHVFGSRKVKSDREPELEPRLYRGDGGDSKSSKGEYAARKARARVEEAYEEVDFEIAQSYQRRLPRPGPGVSHR